MRMERVVAIKVLREVYSTDPKFVTRFQREAKAASSLQHPNIVQVYDYGQSDGNYFIVMELVEGTELRRYLRSRGVLAIDRAIIIAHDVALGLGAAHRRGIVHRDVKPQNILVGRDGSIKLTDFGIASVYKDINAERLTPTGTPLGPALYFAPEQARGEIVSPAADVYALGIVMYEMLTGRTPFDGDTPVAVAMQHIQDLPTPPSQLNPGIPPALEEIITRCLEKVPEMRFRDGSVLARALEQLGEEEFQAQPTVKQFRNNPGIQTSSVSAGQSTQNLFNADSSLSPPQTSSNSGVTEELQPLPGNAETFLQRLVEGPLARVFSSRLEPIEIARKLERAMEDNTLLQGEGRRLAPNIYDIYLSIKDHQQMWPAQNTLVRDWQNHLVEFARSRRYTLHTMPIIRLHADSSLRIGQVRIESEMIERYGGMASQALTAEQLAQLRAQLQPGQQLPDTDNSPPQHSGGFSRAANAPDMTGQRPTIAIPQARLTIHLPNAEQRIYSIEKQIINLGRQLSNDIIVEDKQVSRYHAQIKYQPDGQFAIFDLGSTNGITINNTPYMRQHILHDGDHFTIGSYDFEFHRS